MKRWLSAHIRFRGALYGNEGDEVLMRAVAPALSSVRSTGRVARYFFVRYGVGGPHIRFRVATASRESCFVVREALDAALLVCAPRAGASVEWSAYDREVQRYGGDRGMVISEWFFQASSNLALDCLEDHAVRRSRAARLGRAALASLALSAELSRCHPRTTEQLLCKYAQNAHQLWLTGSALQPSRAGQEAFAEDVQRLQPLLSAAWRRLVTGQPLLDSVDRFRADLRIVRTALERASVLSNESGQDGGLVRRVGVSYLHMMNNRFGVLPPEEYYVATLAASALATDSLPLDAE